MNNTKYGEENDMILTVKVAACGVEKYIDECLSVFACEKYISKVQVIVVVNYSEDNSLKIALRYQDRYPDIFHVVEQGRMDYASTYNTSFNMIMGKYYTNLDGDDYFDNEKFDVYLNELETSNADIVACDFLMFNDNKTRKSSIKKKNICYNKKLNLKDVIDDMSFVEMHSLTIKSKLITSSNINISNGTIGADLEYALKSQLNAKSIMYLDMALYNYRQGHDSQRTGFDKLLKSEQENIKRSLYLLKWINSVEIKDQQKKRYLKKRIAAMISIVFYIFLLETSKKEAYSKITKYYGEISTIDSDIKKYCSLVSRLLARWPKLFFAPLSLCYKIYKKNKQFIY